MAGTQLKASATLGPQDLMAMGALVLEQVLIFQEMASFCLQQLAGASFQEGMCLGHPRAAFGPSFPCHTMTLRKGQGLAMEQQSSSL
jgi:hypothetical protein